MNDLRSQQLETIKNNAIQTIENNLSKLISLTEKEYFSTDCQILLDMILDWKMSKGTGEKEKFQYLWGMWHKVIPVDDDVSFIYSVLSFFSHEILDDGSFSIVWEKNVRVNNSIQTVRGSEKDPDTLPVVCVPTCDEEARNNPRLLIEAMNEAYIRQKKKELWRQEVWEKLQALSAKIHGKD